MHEEGRERHEKQRASDCARSRRVPKERRHAQPAAERLLGTHGRGLREEEEEAAPEAVAQRRLLQGEGVLVEEARDGEGERARSPRRDAAPGERREDGAPEEAVDEQVPAPAWVGLGLGLGLELGLGLAYGLGLGLGLG